MMEAELAKPRCIMRNASDVIIGPTVHDRLPPVARTRHRLVAGPSIRDL